MTRRIAERYQLLHGVNRFRHIQREKYGAVIAMKKSIFWDIKVCSPLKINLRFGEMRRLNLQLCLLPTLCWFLGRLILEP
jgi:hypothetical protein